MALSFVKHRQPGTLLFDTVKTTTKTHKIEKQRAANMLSGQWEAPIGVPFSGNSAAKGRLSRCVRTAVKLRSAASCHAICRLLQRKRRPFAIQKAIIHCTKHRPQYIKTWCTDTCVCTLILAIFTSERFYSQNIAFSKRHQKSTCKHKRR